MSASERVVVNELSSSLLDMKFMLKKKKQIEAKGAKRREARLDAKIAEKEKEGEATSSMAVLPAQKPQEICYDLAKLENLKFGRLSFKGFNKDVEVLMEYYERLQNGELSDEEEDGKDVDDQEMAESLGGQKLAALSKKAQTKRERRQDNEKNVEATGTKFNFKDIRKRRNNEEIEGEPERKFMKPQDD
ncbi:hypothetical protein GCK72_006808 [Caenorhabditis remanei]|uniref:M-phase phosphoprotein 6 n=1 Tax=Caenorhabditis remanei TaxID=31234 RepID=A0A6A5HFW8_CAERE|nr:hypothetical protein GCK72_006808 [Caenorhabditis remanei]KAF1766850.1 hypothetical protein GCK72_006808 [Caenorhabditis remanei]